MRAGLGLVAFMICAFLAMYLWSSYQVESTRVSQKAMRQAEQFAGKDSESGISVYQSIKTEPVETGNGKLQHLKVTFLHPRGPMAKHYGLKEGDEIISIGVLDSRDYDAEMMQAWLMEARARDLRMKVRRDGKLIELPEILLPGQTPQAQQTAEATPETPAGTAEPMDTTNTINKQLKNIPGLK